VSIVDNRNIPKFVSPQSWEFALKEDSSSKRVSVDFECLEFVLKGGIPYNKVPGDHESPEFVLYEDTLNKTVFEGRESLEFVSNGNNPKY
jgi:hypothetical protein